MREKNQKKILFIVDFVKNFFLIRWYIPIRRTMCFNLWSIKIIIIIMLLRYICEDKKIDFWEIQKKWEIKKNHHIIQGASSRFFFKFYFCDDKKMTTVYGGGGGGVCGGEHHQQWNRKNTIRIYLFIHQEILSSSYNNNHYIWYMFCR